MKTTFEIRTNDAGIRPAGRPDECFYCHRRVGDVHRETCVTLAVDIIPSVRAPDGTTGYTIGPGLTFTHGALKTEPAPWAAELESLKARVVALENPHHGDPVAAGRAMDELFTKYRQQTGRNIGEKP